MKARLVKNSQKGLILLCEDGTIMQPDMRMLYQILTSASKKGVTFQNGQLGSWMSEYPDMSLYPGKDIASIADNGAVILYDFSPFRQLVAADFEAQNLLSTSEFAKKHNASPEMVKVYCRQGRIRGAWKSARNWLIPADAEWPVEPHRRKPRQTQSRSSKK